MSIPKLEPRKPITSLVIYNPAWEVVRRKCKASRLNSLHEEYNFKITSHKMLEIVTYHRVSWRNTAVTDPVSSSPLVYDIKMINIQAF